jgi:hypothetical protein
MAADRPPYPPDQPTQIADFPVSQALMQRLAPSPAKAHYKQIQPAKMGELYPEVT